MNNSRDTSHPTAIRLDLPPGFNEDVVSRFTQSLTQAASGEECVVLSDYGRFKTDRPANVGHPKHTGIQGNSESEASFPFDLLEVCKAAQIKNPRVTLNSLRLFGQVHDTMPLHFHGYPRELAKEGKNECVIFSIKAISRYNPESGAIDQRNTERVTDTPTLPDNAVVMITIRSGRIVALPLHVGDVVVLPSGVFHEFACLEGIYADISSIEIADLATGLGVATWNYDDSIYQKAIRTSFEIETGTTPDTSRVITLGDIPSIKPYTEGTHHRRDAAVVSLQQ